MSLPIASSEAAFASAAAAGANRSRPWNVGAAVIGEILYVDHFGNLISNVPAADLGPTARAVLAGRDVGPLRRTFSDVPPGQVVVYVGSGGTVEVAVRDGSAAERLDLGVGAELRVTA